MTNLGDQRTRETAVSLSVGDVVADRYRIDAVLGEGGMGVVYRVEHLHLRKPHALKVLLPEWSSMPEVMARFEREAIVAGQIHSPHVVAATDFGRLPGGSFFLVMEYVNGRTLRAALEAGALAPARALHVLRGVVSALHAAHALGIVHRDLKPENIMLVEREGDPDFVKVLDFGIAKLEGFAGATQRGTSKALTQVGAVIGTAEYMSPEQALGQAIDARSDLYSAGVVLFEMLTGRRPFGGSAVTILRQHIMAEAPELPPAVTAGLDPPIGAILRRLLSKLPEDRYANTADLMSALDEFSNVGGLRASPAPTHRSLESVPAMTTPIAQRVRRSVLAGVKAVEGATRRALADPKALRWQPTRGTLFLAALVAAIVATMFVLLAAGSRTHAPTSTAPPLATDPVAVVVAPSPPPVPSSTSSVEVAPVWTLPPPPAPSSSTERPASPHERSRRTGPGGIYIPPPSQWFN